MVIFGYGEDALTFWAVKEKIGTILNAFKDGTPTTDCLVFYRPSFGRSGGPKSAEFGEFDSIIASRKNVYLIESKWDNLGKSKKGKIALRKEQILRHEIFAWYLVNWNKKFLGDWQSFTDSKYEAFKVFEKKLPTSPSGKKKLLASNLELVLHRLKDHCTGFTSITNVKNVLLFFYNSEISDPPSEVNADFTLIPVDYNRMLEGNFIPL